MLRSKPIVDGDDGHAARRRYGYGLDECATAGTPHERATVQVHQHAIAVEVRRHRRDPMYRDARDLGRHDIHLEPLEHPVAQAIIERRVVLAQRRQVARNICGDGRKVGQERLPRCGARVHGERQMKIARLDGPVGVQLGPSDSIRSTSRVWFAWDWQWLSAQGEPVFYACSVRTSSIPPALDVVKAQECAQYGIDVN